MRPRAEPGFTLVETVIAAGVLAVSLVALAHLAVVATHLTMAAGALTTSAVMAQQKMEQLRAVDWQAVAFAPSPPGTLDQDVAGYVEYLDADGRVRGDPGPEVSSMFVRRWAVTRLTDRTRLVEILVKRHRLTGSVGGAIGEFRLTSIRSHFAP